MENDRIVICDIISEMLDNPDPYGIYPTTRAYDKLEKYIESVRTDTCQQAEKEGKSESI